MHANNTFVLSKSTVSLDAIQKSSNRSFTCGESRFITILGCFSGDGKTSDECIVVGSQPLLKELLDIFPHARFILTDKGQLNDEVYNSWLDVVLLSIKAHADSAYPILLTLEGYGSHIPLPFASLAQAKGFVLVSEPAHTTRDFQPVCEYIRSLYHE
ncbi:hypothetical protein BT96DRAFT_80988 [Gymnopus androsaceus JB14]|uniref:DDE-1 domain-containing protein n=1 Tax=Gymnopus androsaceus JB14 TaxID=1447944 RepID=A0A6A4IAJ9_9AGAR|nr:hypothetical protein BT96DRAFT_80988 [Gymnopus androsaceus JB14]